MRQRDKNVILLLAIYIAITWFWGDKLSIYLKIVLILISGIGIILLLYDLKKLYKKLRRSEIIYMADYVVFIILWDIIGVLGYFNGIIC